MYVSVCVYSTVYCVVDVSTHPHVFVVFFCYVLSALCIHREVNAGIYRLLCITLQLYVFVSPPTTVPTLSATTTTLSQALFRRPQLKALVDIQAEVTNITNQEAHIIAGALDLATKTAKSAMTPLDKVCVWCVVV